MDEIQQAMSLYTSAIMSQIITTYWLYKGDASTQIEDVDRDELLKELMTDSEFMNKVMDAIQKVGLS